MTRQVASKLKTRIVIKNILNIHCVGPVLPVQGALYLYKVLGSHEGTTCPDSRGRQYVMGGGTVKNT